MTTSEQILARLARLREAMRSAQIQAVVIPSTDPHQSEYLAKHWEARAHFSGFTGSAGTLVVTADKAGLWTDSRYYLQAEKQLPAGVITLFKSQESGVPTIVGWLGSELSEGAAVSWNGWLLAAKEAPGKVAEFESKGLKLNLLTDPVALAWPERPNLPESLVFEHAESLAGKSRQEKLATLRSSMAEARADHYIVCALDDIAWALNLRGTDIDFNPVFYAYLVVHQLGATLYIDPAKVSSETREHLALSGVDLAHYDDFMLSVGKLDGRIAYDPATTAYPIEFAIPKENRIPADNWAGRIKACKNEVEIIQWRRAMAKDGAALVRLFMWLEKAIDDGITELQVSDKLIGFRAEMPGYVGESFPAIVGYAANGAIVHYRPGEDSAWLKRESLLLLDCGGQYVDGTTDITRTIALGEPTAEQRRNFTLVLKGHIALAMAVFPEGTGGYQLDVYARAPLWSAGLNYGHGTGHGVGYFLNVHEGPQSIRNGYSERAAVPLAPGMVTSNEPGYYETGVYGIRFENLILCVHKQTTAYGKFLGFETLSLLPIDRQLVDESILTKQEVGWINDYHQLVKNSLSPLLNDAEKAWLADACRPLA